MKLKYIIAIGGMCSSLLIATNSQATETTVATESLLKPIDKIEEIINMDNIPQEGAKVGQVTTNPVSAEDLRWLSAIIWAEAGNQCEAGQQAVGIVVMNRMKCETYFANTVHDVIYEPGQFSPVDNGSYNVALRMYDTGTLPISAIEAATYVLEGNSVIKYKEIYYDMSSYLYFSRWVYGCRLQIQDHMFK